MAGVIGLHACFRDPHNPWRHLPRKASLTDRTDADIGDAIWNLEATPRKRLGYRTPIEAFAARLGGALEP